MGYTVSIQAIEKMAPLLDTLLTSKEPILTLESENPKRLVFLIRSALYSVKEFNYEKYLSLVNAYEIKYTTKKITFVRKIVSDSLNISVPHRSFPEFDDLEIIDYLTKNELSPGIEYKFRRFPALVPWITRDKKLVAELTDEHLIVSLPKE